MKNGILSSDDDDDDTTYQNYKEFNSSLTLTLEEVIQTLLINGAESEFYTTAEKVISMRVD